MYQQSKFSKGFIPFLASAMLGASAAWSGTVLADDTEVFFPPVEVVDDEQVRPNLLFIMDTSGSMGTRDGGSGTPTRLEKVQDALIELLQGISQNVNVGLMRLSDDEGGPVLFPVSHISGTAKDALAGGSCPADAGSVPRPPIFVQSVSGQNWAYELQTSDDVVVGSSYILLGGDSSGSGVFTGDTETLSNLLPDNNGDVEYNASSGSSEVNSRSDDDLDFASNGGTDVNITFRNINLPQGATIVDARITFLQSGYNNQAQSNTQINITAHDVDDSSNPSGSNFSGRFNNDTSGQPGGEIFWGGPGVFPDSDVQDDPITSPNLASLVQLIVNRPGWNPNNDISFLFDGLQGHFSVWSRNKSQGRSPRLQITYSEGPATTDTVEAGIRFPGVNVPQGVSIASATLSVTPDLTSGLTAGLAHFRLYGEKSDDSAVFSATNGDVSSRSLTTDFEEINIADAAGLTPGTPLEFDVKGIVEEIAAQSGWCGGNAMSFLAKPESDNVALLQLITALSDPDNPPSLSVELDATDPDIETGCQSYLASGQIDGGDDDVEQESDDDVNRGSVDLDIGQHPYIGLRFNNLRILKGAEILDARLEFTARSSRDTTSPNVTVHVDTVDDADPIQGNDDEIDDRFDDGATAGVAWDLGDWTQEETYRSPNLKDIVKTVVDRGGWSPGNSMLLFVKQGSGDRREAYSYNSSPGKAPRLVILARGGTGTVEETVRERLISVVEDFQDQGLTPLAEVLTEAAYYYRGENVHFGRTRGSGIGLNDPGNHNGSGQDDLTGANQMRISQCSTYTGGTQVDPNGCNPDNPNDSDCSSQRITGNPIYRSPIKQGCQSNNIVLLSDGLPNSNTENDLIRDMIGRSCTGSGNGGCGIDLAAWLNANDQASTFDGDQKITTYTIGFSDDVGSGTTGGEYLRQMANAGGGSFSTANESAELIRAFQAIVAEILDENTTFVAPAVTINAFNRLSNLDQLYFALFQPRAQPRWPGNLKRFKLVAGSNAILDANGENAVDIGTGYFAEEATSFWTVGTPDAPDGGVVSKGGALQQLPAPASRNIYTNINSSILAAADNALSKSNGSLTPLVMGTDDSADPNGERDAVLDWARGLDVNDEDGDGSTTDARDDIIGDPLHSKPAVVNYGGTAENPQLVIFMGTNQGFLHAFDSRTGQELFSFIPKELLTNLEVYKNNFGSQFGRPYGMDGAIVVDQTNPSEKVLIAGMRRGGNNYYALDVTNTSDPKQLWQISGGTGDFQFMGQTWATPKIVKVQIGTTVKKVILLSGGYDTGQDSGESPRITDSVGQMLYMVDYEDGSLLWSAGNAANSPTLSVPGMNASIAGSPNAIDLDSDGIIDRVYLADLNAKILRFDFYKENSGASDMAKAYVYADLGGADVANNRRIYNDVDVALVQPTGKPAFLSLSVGTGYQAHPLEQGVQDRFYILKDYDAAPVDSTERQAYFERPFNFDSDLNGTIETSEQGQILGPIAASELIDASVDTFSVRSEFGRARGGFIDMRDGEKVLTTATTFDNGVFVSTFQPPSGSSDICKAGQGTSRLYSIDVTTFGPKLFDDDLEEPGDGTGGTPAPTDDGGDGSTPGPTDGSGTPDPGSTPGPTDGATPTPDYEVIFKPRDEELPIGGLPPDPVILFPEGDSGVPENAVICIGPFCEDPGFGIVNEKTFWQEN